MTFDRWVGVHTGGAHYLDHLGILCEGLEIPLIVTEQETFEVAQEFYPQLQVEYRDLSDLTLSFLAERADVIFESGHHFALELIPLWELLYKKKMRVVYCPHGNSDKKQKTRKDISLIYGNHMYRHLEKTGEMKRTGKTIPVGNYRSLYYQAKQKWYDDKLEIHLENRLIAGRKNVFYAPTWSDSWLKHGLRVIEEIGSVFNLFLRWHPFLDDLYPAESEKMREVCKQRNGVIDLSTFPSIYPILQKADFYLGDFSSVGYDFLSLNKPLFFLSGYEGEIYSCGIELAEDDHWGKMIQQFQEDEKWEKKRIKLSKEVFCENLSFKAIKTKLKEALSSDRASWI